MQILIHNKCGAPRHYFYLISIWILYYIVLSVKPYFHRIIFIPSYLHNVRKDNERKGVLGFTQPTRQAVIVRTQVERERTRGPQIPLSVREQFIYEVIKNGRKSF